MKRLFLLFLLFTIFCSQLKANIELPKIFADHLVLQRNAPINIWGWADKGEKVTVILHNQRKSTTANRDGYWKIVLDALPAGGPFILTVKGKNTLSFKDVMIGEVWLCSGQSNMAWVVKDTHKAKEEITSANYPMIRHFKVPEIVKGEPARDLESGAWKVCSPETVVDFTAVGYYFAKQLHQELNIAVGLINASWGGTYIEAWMSHGALTQLKEYKGVPKLSNQELENWYASVEDLYKGYAKKMGVEHVHNYKVSDSLWHHADFDDNKWLDIELPGNFDQTVLPRFDGTVWFRTNFNLPENFTNQNITLHLGKIDDVDETYINGIKVGGKEGAHVSRDYTVDASILKPGKNNIAIKVLDYWERGGFLNAKENFFVENVKGQKHSLTENKWKMSLAEVRLLWIRTPNVHPNVLYNGMINPIIPYTIKGVLWYQGENNIDFAYQYRELLPVLIKDWRTQWKQGDFPFYFVQLPNYQRFMTNSQNGGSNWAVLRESFSPSLKLPNTGMAVTIDVGDSTDIHPRNKEDVGKRLSYIALHKLYNASTAPIGAEVDTVEFNIDQVMITFKNTAQLVAHDRYGYVKGFEVADKDQKFHYANATINGNKITVHSPIDNPVALRYAWSNNPDGNVFTQTGLPISPFRTDTWPVLTQDARYDSWIGNRFKIFSR